MNKTLAILAISISSIFSIDSVFADSAKLINPNNNHTYKRFDTVKTWIQAKNACANQGGYLATITSKEENDWLATKKLPIVNNGYGTWLGATDSVVEGKWEWITGESFVYSDWKEDEPNESAGGEDFLEIYPTGMYFGGTWNDSGLPGYNSGNRSYICEWGNKSLKNYTNMIIADTNNDNVSEFVLVGNNGLVNKVVSIDRQNKTV